VKFTDVELTSSKTNNYKKLLNPKTSISKFNRRMYYLDPNEPIHTPEVNLKKWPVESEENESETNMNDTPT